MDSATPSTLSLLGAAIYIVVALTCLWASRGEIGAAPGRGARPFWFLVAVTFFGLAMLRVVAAEDIARDHLRLFLDQENARELRRAIQIPLAASLVLIAVGLMAWMAKRLRILRERSRSRLRLIAGMALVAMAGLMSLRIVSLHYTDWLLFSGLFGPIRLNWIVDLGASATVFLCAILHRRYSLPGRSKSNRSVSQYRK